MAEPYRSRLRVGTRVRVGRALATLFAGGVFAGNLAVLVDLARHLHDVPRLADLAPTSLGKHHHLPHLSVILAARNEEVGIHAAIESLLDQDLAGLEIVAVDDRSTDATPAILARLAAAHPDRLRVVTLDSLPAGWLGKNHAHWRGARVARGEWLLFTDADVVFARSTLRRALAYATAHGLDHLTLAPDVRVRGYWLSAFVSFFVYAFQVSQRPYRANDPRSPHGIGVGAFNLVRREAYEGIGTHAALSLRPDDDLRLGQRLKLGGWKQRVLSGVGLVEVEWYASLRDAVRGLEKNSFAAFEYSLPRSVAGVSALLGGMLAPWLLVWRGPRAARGLHAATMAVQAATFVGISREGRRPAWRVLPAYPLGVALFGYTVARGVLLSVVRGGIRWRETFYPLALLRSQTGLENIPMRQVAASPMSGGSRA